MTQTTHTTLGELIAEIYDEMMALYGDEDLASVAAAALVNDLIARSTTEERYEDAA